LPKPKNIATFEIQRIFVVSKGQDILMVLHKSKFDKKGKMKRTEVFKIYDFEKFKHK
jgi:hypothetical protein